MISYDNLWNLLKNKGITKYELYTRYKISKTILYRMYNNEYVSLNTIDKLCDVLDCNVEDIITHYKSTK